MMTNSFVTQLVAKLQAEVDEIKELILDTLHFCMRVDTDHALGAGAMEVYTDLLTHSIDTIRAKVKFPIVGCHEIENSVSKIFKLSVPKLRPRGTSWISPFHSPARTRL